MTKNKKKLRRAERRYSVSRTAQTLVLTGLLVASGVGTALAATTWDPAKNVVITTDETLTKNESAATLTINSGTLTTAHRIYATGVTTLAGGTLNLIGQGGLFGSLDDTLALVPGTFVMTNGNLNVGQGTQGSQVQVGKVSISGGTVSIQGKGDDDQKTWENNPKIYGGVGANTGSVVAISGGTINIGENGQIGAERDSTVQNSIDITGGHIIMGAVRPKHGAMIRASSDPHLEASDSKHVKLNISGTANIEIVEGKYAVFVSRETAMTGGALNVNGTLTMAGSISAGNDITTGIYPSDGSTAKQWGTFTQSAGAVNVASTGLLLGQMLDFTQTGGTFNTGDLYVGAIGDWSDKYNFASFKSVTLDTNAVATVAGTLHVTGDAKLNITGDASLTTNHLNLMPRGQINITGNGGTSSSLNIEKDITLAAADFAGIATEGKIALMNNGRVWVHGKLTLKGADATEQSLATKGAVKVWSLDVVKADNSLGDVKVTGDGNFGQLSITAKDNTNIQKVVANAGQLWATDKGTIKFGEEHFNSAGTINANLKAGGADATNNKGTIAVVGGSWELAAGKTVDIVTGGTLTVGALDDGAYSPTNFDASQGTLKVAADASKAEVRQLSSLKLKLSDITTDYVALDSNIKKVIVNDGLLILSGFAGADTSKNMNIGDVTKLTNSIMSGTGTVKLDGVTITTDANTKLSEVAGAKLSLETAVVQADAMASGAAVVGGLHGATTTTAVTGANLTLTGQGSTGGQLIAGTVGKTGIALDNAATLTLGNAAASTASSGTLVGDVTIGNTTAGSTINAVNGNYTVTGNITGGTKGDTINVVGANLSANEISTGGSVASTINVNGGALSANKLTTTGVDTVNVNGGSLNVSEVIATTGDTINVGNSAAAGTLTADKMTLAGGTLFLDPSWIDGQQFQDAGLASRAAITAFAAGIDGDVVVGQNSQLSLGTKNVEQLTAAIGQMGNVWGASGITAAVGIYSAQTLDALGSITVDGSLNAAGNPTANSATFADKSLLVVSAAGVGSGVALTGVGSKLTVDTGAKLHILGGKSGETINIVAGFTGANGAIDANGWAGANLTTDTALLTATAGPAFTAATGSYSITLNQNAAAPIFPKLSTSMGGLVDTIVGKYGVDTMSGNTGIRFISRAVSDSFIGTNDPTRAAATIEGAAQLAAVGATPGMTISASTAATTASNTRTSFATPLMDNTKAVALHQGTDGTISLDSGLSAGSSMKTGLGVWIMPLYQSNNVWGMEAENFKSGYKSDLGGVVLGADYTIDDSLRFGLAFNLGGGYAQSTGDFNATDNNFNFWGLNLYGGWSQNNFGISGDVGYTSTYNKVKQETPTALQMGDIKSDVTSRAWTAGLRGEYKFATEALDIIPHVGVRYLGLTSDSYKAKIGGETVFKADEAYQSIWTFPVGVTFAKEITNDSGWTFRPQVDLGITPATGDVKAKSRVRIPNVDGSAEMKMQVMDYMSYDGGIGLEMKKDNVSFGVNYNIQASEHRTGHGVFGTLRYEF